MANNEQTVIVPQNRFWTVTVEIKEQDPETEKWKKSKEDHLIDARSATEAESKLKDYMADTMAEWKAVKYAESKTVVVY